MEGHITCPWRERVSECVYVCVFVPQSCMTTKKKEKKKLSAQAFHSVPEYLQSVRACGLFCFFFKKGKKIGDET